MLQTIDVRNREFHSHQWSEVVPRAGVEVSDVTETVALLIDEVRSGGASALLEQARRFDGVLPDSIRVPEEHLDEALSTLNPELRVAFEETIHRVRQASLSQVPPPTITEIAQGAFIEQRWQPVERVGLYVPGGKAVYPSSVAMNVIAAQAAGVDSIALASPSQQAAGGRVDPSILAMAALLGVDEIYAMGGAGAIAAFAFGISDLDLVPVDVITGPGNVFVAAAKRIVSSVVGIDSEAGPTDIVVIADAHANADWVAADLVSQAEHDELAAAVLVTDDADFADAVNRCVTLRAAQASHRDRVEASLSGRQSAIVLVSSLSDAAAFSNAYAPEHLELQVSNPEAVLSLIRNAGVIFIGPYAPVPLGDYMAGSNHVLPTGGQARYRSALSASTFLRPQQVVRYDRSALEQLAPLITRFAQQEGLPAHGAAVTTRFEA